MSKGIIAFHYVNGSFLSFVARIVLGLPDQVPHDGDIDVREQMYLLKLLIVV